jgi:hypothetical protein
MDQAKIFSNFLKNYNLHTIAKQYEDSCLKKSYLLRTRVLSRDFKFHE